MYRRILVPTDGTPRSTRAVKTAAALARSGGGLVTLFHSSPEYRTPYYPEGVPIEWPTQKDYARDSAAAADKLFEKARAICLKEGIDPSTLHEFSDSPADAILAAARKVKADVIVMASHGRKGFEALLLGSETQKVLAKATIPILVVR